MKHYYVAGPRQIEVVEEPIPEPGAGEVLVAWPTRRSVQAAMSTVM